MSKRKRLNRSSNNYKVSSATKKKKKKKKKKGQSDSWESSSYDHAGRSNHDDGSSPSDSNRSKLRTNDKHYNELNSSECPIRKSPRKSILTTTRKIHEMAHDSYTDEEYSDQDIDADIKTFKATKKQRQNDGDDSYRECESEVEKDEEDDDDFDDDNVENEERDLFNDEMSFENDVESSDDDSSGSNDDDAKCVKRTPKKTTRIPSRNINNDDIFDQEEDSEDDKYKSPMKRVQVTPLKLKKRGQFQYDSSEDEKEITTISVNGVAKDDEIVELAGTPNKMPLCTSEYDEITNELLPTLHVCYLAPDGKSRHCFCLETLYKAAILSGPKIQKKDGKGGLCFLQPPHFRTVMEDTLIDQIASRFGRQALVIEDSQLYKNESKRKAIQWEYEIEDGDDEEEVRSSFRRRFDNYLNRQMGSGDIYCCPLCYAEAQRRFKEGDDWKDDDHDDDDEDDDDEDDDDDDDGKDDEEGGDDRKDDEEDDDDGKDDDDSSENDKSEESDASNNQHHEFEYNMDSITSYSQIDPMSILGSLDHDEFEVAASFCFHKLSQVKNHVRSIHNIDLSNVEVNDFFKRFMIRAQDGLLQRYLHAFWKHRIFSGAMRKYWFEGHNQNYILLRVLIDRRYYMNEIDHGFAEDHFCKSFQRRALKIWKGLSAPYSRLYESDFIDSGEEEIEDIPHPVFEPPTESVEDAFVEHLRKKIQNTQGRKHGYDSSSSDDQDDESKGESGDDEDEIIHVDGSDEEDVYVEESSEDDWMASKRSKHKKHQSMRIKKGRLKHNKDVMSGSDDDEVFKRSNRKGIGTKLATQLSSSEDESNSDKESSDSKQSSDYEQSPDDQSEDSNELEVRNTPSKKLTILESDDD